MTRGRQNKQKKEKCEKTNLSIKVFSLLPQKKIRPINISIDTTILKEIHKKISAVQQNNIEDNPDNNGNNNVNNLEVANLWEHYFNLKRVTSNGNKTFAKLLLTDGTSVSVTVSKPKVVKVVEDLTPEMEEDAKQKHVSQLFKNAGRVVVVDHGRSPIFTAVVHNQQTMDDLQKEDKDRARHKVIKWSRGKVYRESGHTHRVRKTRVWIAAAPLVATFNAEVHSTKTSSLHLYKQYVRHVIANIVPLMEFYNAQRFKRLHWKSYIKSQQVYERIVDDLVVGKDKRKEEQKSDKENIGCMG